MNREEQMFQAASDYIKQRIKEGQGQTGDVFPAYIEGIEWADEHPNPELKKQWMKKACNWLRKHGGFTLGITGAEVNDFCKYMEDKL